MFIPEWQRIVFLCLARPADLAPSPPKSVSIELPSVPNTYQIRKQCQNPSPAYLKIITQKLPDIPIPPPPFFLKNKKKTKETLCSSGWDFPFLRKIERNPSVISRIQLFLNDYHLQRYLFIIKWTGTISWDSSVVFPFLWFFLWYASPPPPASFFSLEMSCALLVLLRCSEWYYPIFIYLLYLKTPTDIYSVWIGVWNRFDMFGWWVHFVCTSKCVFKKYKKTNAAYSYDKISVIVILIFFRTHLNVSCQRRSIQSYSL